MLMAPAAIGFVVFFVYPLIATVYFSFTRYNLADDPIWVGLRNYRFFFADDPHVWQAIRNTAWLVAIMIPARMCFGLFVAGVLTTIRRGAGWFRALYYLPALAPPVAATLAFVFLFNPATGPVNTALKQVGINGPLWFNDSAWAKPALVLLGLWGVGDIMIIFLAALLDVPTSQYEAATLDGANAVQRWRYITLPTISPVLMFAAITGSIQTLQYFTQAAVAATVASGKSLVGQGVGSQLGYPDFSTLTFPQWIYFQGFNNYFLGYASALSVVLFAFAFGFMALLLRRSRSLINAGEDV
jgi:multiple sugar transport system permease protein